MEYEIFHNLQNHLRLHICRCSLDICSVSRRSPDQINSSFYGGACKYLYMAAKTSSGSELTLNLLDNHLGIFLLQELNPRWKILQHETALHNSNESYLPAPRQRFRNFKCLQITLNTLITELCLKYPIYGYNRWRNKTQ